MTATPTTLLVKTLIARGLTIATAESLTGGMLAGELVNVPGASATFVGGIVSYHTELKRSLLGVAGEQLAETGPVDSVVAEQMAEGARQACAVNGRAADIGLSTTGVAGPDPDAQSGQPAGTVYVGIATADGARSVRLSLSGDRATIRSETVSAVIAEAANELESMTALPPVE